MKKERHKRRQAARVACAVAELEADAAEPGSRGIRWGCHMVVLRCRQYMVAVRCRQYVVVVRCRQYMVVMRCRQQAVHGSDALQAVHGRDALQAVHAAVGHGGRASRWPAVHTAL